MLNENKISLSSNALKIIAAVSMLIDHIGVIMFPSYDIFRIIGRLAFPIFSFLICEGCRYTRNKCAYFLRIFVLGILTSAVYFIESGKIYFDVLITFSFSIILIFLLQKTHDEENFHKRLIFIFLFLSLTITTYFFTENVTVDYGFWGIMLPVFPALADVVLNENKYPLVLQKRFFVFAIALLALAFSKDALQFYSLFALIPLALYNGKKGFKLPKYFFYIFYPAHIALIWLVNLIIDKAF